MTNIPNQSGEHRKGKGAEIDYLVESTRLPALHSAIYNVISSSLGTRREVALEVISSHEAQRSQAPQIRPVEAAPAAASVALDATVEAPTPAVGGEPDMLHEEVPQQDMVDQENYWRGLEASVTPEAEAAMGAQVDAAYSEAGVDTFPEASEPLLDAARASVDAAYGSPMGTE